jgi:hypothetical protein
MKRPHRRIHLVIWPVIFLATAFGMLAASRLAPADPLTDIPDAAIASGGR